MIAEKWMIVVDKDGSFVTLVNPGAHVFLGAGSSAEYFDDEAGALEREKQLTLIKLT